MKNLPSRLTTMQDIYNCYDLVKNEGYNPSEFLVLLDNIKNLNYQNIYIREISDDGKTVEVNFCNEAEPNKFVFSNNKEIKILSVTHNDGEADEMGNINKESSTIVLEDAINKDDTFLYLCEVPSIYDRMNLKKVDFDSIYSDILSMLN